MEIELPIEQKKETVWDNYVPLITAGRVTDVYLTDGIEAPSEYNHLCRTLDQAYKGDVINLHINNGGGYVDSGFMIIDAIKRSKATVVAKLSGTVASVATIISLSCDKLEIAPYVQFMIHNYSGGASGKGHEMRAQMEFTDTQLNLAFTEIYGNFLTPHEMELVIAGKDLWMGVDETTARFNFMRKKDGKGLEAYTKAMLKK